MRTRPTCICEFPRGAAHIQHLHESASLMTDSVRCPLLESNFPAQREEGTKALKTTAARMRTSETPKCRIHHDAPPTFDSCSTHPLHNLPVSILARRVCFCNINISLNIRKINELAANDSWTTTNPNPIMCPQALETGHWQSILTKTHRKPQEKPRGCDGLLMLGGFFWVSPVLAD